MQVIRGGYAVRTLNLQHRLNTKGAHTVPNPDCEGLC